MDIIEFECEHVSEEDEELKVAPYITFALGHHTCVTMCLQCYNAMIGSIVQSIILDTVRFSSIGGVSIPTPPTAFDLRMDDDKSL